MSTASISHYHKAFINKLIKPSEKIEKPKLLN